MTPLNTGKVRIGLSYVPPRRVNMDSDDLFIQSLLLRKPQTVSQRVRATLVAIVVGFISTFSI